jgi:hypothetical protein
VVAHLHARPVLTAVLPLYVAMTLDREPVVGDPARRIRRRSDGRRTTGRRAQDHPPSLVSSG